MRELTFRDVIQLLKKRMIYILCIVLLATGITAAIEYNLPNEYTAETVLYVLQSYEDDGYTIYELNSSTSFAADYYELITTEDVLKLTADKLGVKSLDNVEIHVTSSSGTRVLKVLVTAESEEFAVRAVNALCSVFVDYVSSIIDLDMVRVVSEASFARLTGPAKTRNTILAGIGAALVAIFAFLAAEMLDNTFREESDVMEALNISVLASVPNTKKEMENYYKKGRKGQKSLYYAVSEKTREGIQTLVANLRFVTQGKNAKKFLMSSTVPKEGKTSMSVMLAYALAQYDNNVCIVDLDYRNPSVDRALKQKSKGEATLFDYLYGKADLREVVRRTSENGVYSVGIASRNFHMNQVFDSPRFDQFCSEISEIFDYVIFDTPPIGMYIDAALLATKMDGVFMVIRRGNSDRKATRAALEQFRKAKANVLGAIMTFAAGSHNNHYYHDYYKNYERKKTARIQAAGKKR